MKKYLPGPLPDNARNLMRQLGYGERQGRAGQTSFAKRITGMPYPRYHAYVEDRDGGMQVNLHVDQKEASYKGSSAHGGEYEGPLVEKEMQRIVSVVQSMNRPPKPSEPSEPSQSKGFWGNLFG